AGTAQSTPGLRSRCQPEDGHSISYGLLVERYDGHRRNCLCRRTIGLWAYIPLRRCLGGAEAGARTEDPHEPPLPLLWYLRATCQVRHASAPPILDAGSRIAPWPRAAFQQSRLRAGCVATYGAPLLSHHSRRFFYPWKGERSHLLSFC